MHRRKFLLTPIALASMLQYAQSAAQSQSRVDASTRIALTFSKIGAGSRALYRNVGNLVPGTVSIQADLWLRVDIDPPPAGGVLVRPAFRIIEDSFSGRRPLMNETNIQAKSAPGSNEVHLTGTASGVSHDDVMRPLWLEITIVQAAAVGAAAQSKATVSTVAGKDSYVIVSCS